MALPAASQTPLALSKQVKRLPDLRNLGGADGPALCVADPLLSIRQRLAKDGTSNSPDGRIFNAATTRIIDGGALPNCPTADIDMGTPSALDPASVSTIEASFNPQLAEFGPAEPSPGKIDKSAQNGYMIWCTASGSWYHLALTWDGATYTIYVNGSPAHALRRSAGWIMTEYANYSSPSFFYAVRAENIAPSTTGAGFGYTL